MWCEFYVVLLLYCFVWCVVRCVLCVVCSVCFCSVLRVVSYLVVVFDYCVLCALCSAMCVGLLCKVRGVFCIACCAMRVVALRVEGCAVCGFLVCCAVCVVRYVTSVVLLCGV